MHRWATCLLVAGCGSHLSDADDGPTGLPTPAPVVDASFEPPPLMEDPVPASADAQLPGPPDAASDPGAALDGGMPEAGFDGGDAGPVSDPCPDWHCDEADCDEVIEMPGSTDPESDQAVAAGYYIAHPKYRYLRRDLVKLLMWATCQVQQRFPGTPPLGLADLSGEGGALPGSETGNPRHPSGTHQGNDMDLAYYQTDGTNDPEIICGDGTDTNGNSCCGDYNDGDFCTTEDNIVDWPAQAFFMAKMAVVEEDRIFGIDQTLDDDFEFWFAELVEMGILTRDEVDDVNLGFGSSGGWQFHHHHVHLSYCRIGYSGGGCPRPLFVGDDYVEGIVPP